MRQNGWRIFHAKKTAFESSRICVRGVEQVSNCDVYSKKCGERWECQEETEIIQGLHGHRKLI